MTSEPPGLISDAQAIITSQLAECDAGVDCRARRRQLRAAAVEYTRLTDWAILDGQPRLAATYAEVAHALKDAYATRWALATPGD